MKINFIRLFLYLLLFVVVSACVEMNTGFLGKTSKQPEQVVEEPVVQKRYEKVTASRLNLRERDSSKAKILAVLKRDESVEILAEKNGWVEVKSNTGIHGWVSGTYLTGFEKEKAAKQKQAGKTKTEPVPVQKHPEVAKNIKKEEVVTTKVKEPVAEQKVKKATEPTESELPSARQRELNILGIIPGMDFQEACTIAEQLYMKHKAFFDKADENGFYDKRVFQEAEDPYGYYDSWCGVFEQTGGQIEINERGGLLLKKQYGKLVYMALSPDVVDVLFDAGDMDAAALVKVLEKDFNVTPWETVDMIDSQTQKVAYSIYECKIGPLGSHLSITLRPQKFLEMDDFRVEAAAKKATPRVINVQLTNPGDPLEQKLVDTTNDFRKALEEGDLEAFEKHNPTGEKPTPEEFNQMRGMLLAFLPDFTNAKGEKFEHDEKNALLVYRTNLENEKMITLESMRFSLVDGEWKIGGGMYSTTFDAVSKTEDEKAIADKLAEEPQFQLQVPEVVEDVVEQKSSLEAADVEVKAGTYGSLVENGFEMEIKGVIALWNPERKELAFTLWPFEPTPEEIEYIQWGISSLFWKTGRPDPEPGQWHGKWPYGKYTVSWSMDEDSVGDHSKAWIHVYTYGISQENNNINLNSNQYRGTVKGTVKEGAEIELFAKGEDDLSDTKLAWTINYKGTILPAMSKDALPPSGNYTVIEGLGDKYTGDWLDGKKHGQGTFTERDGDQYSGEWENDKKHGRGTFTWSDGRTYTGEWQDDTFSGRGVFVEANGDTYDGQWKDGRPDGLLAYTSPSGRKYEGEWKEGREHGKGKLTVTRDGKLDYEYDGEWQDGMWNGQGTYTDSSGGKYAGTWKEGKKDGQFEFTDSTGKVHKQTFKNDKQVKQEARVQEAYTGEGQLVTQYPLNLYESDSAEGSVVEAAPSGETLEILQTKGRWVNVKRKSGMQGWAYMPTPVEMDRFNTSIKTGQADAVREYLDRGMPMYMVYGPNVHNALHTALMFNQNEVAAILISKGADVNVRNSMDDTPLQAVTKSCSVKKPEVVQMLVDAGADVNAQTKSKHTDDVWTALYWVEMNLANLQQGSAGWENCNNIKEILLRAGAK